MRKLTLIPNLFDQSSWETIETDDICAALQQKYAEFPHTARIYIDNVSLDNDVTPHSQEDIDALQAMEGEFYAVVYPGDPATLLYIAYAIIAVVVIVAITQKPKVPNASTRNYQSQSPNNALSGRTNQARINNRIPDIYGELRSTPDLLAVPYSIFKAHIEYEYCYMCIGRGQFEIDETTVRDGQTPVTSIDGESVQVYLPNTSPNTGDAPQLAIGPTIDRPVIAAVRSKSVNGQTLVAPNDNSDTASNYSGKIGFNYLGDMANDTGDGTDFTDNFAIGDTVQLNTSAYTYGAANAGYIASDYIGGASVLSPVFNVRFHSDGTIEFEFAMGVPVGGAGQGSILDLFEITDATVFDGSTPYSFAGKYVNGGYSGNSAIVAAPINSNANWGLIASVFGGVTPWVAATFNSPNTIHLNYSGVFTIAAITPIRITFAMPSTGQANNNWAWLRSNLHFGDRENFSSVTLGPYSPGTDLWIGPFVIDITTVNQIIANYVALNGMYKDNGSVQTATSVDIQLGVTPCDTSGVATGPENYFTATVVGSDITQATRAITLFADLPTPGRYMVRSRRLTPLDLDFVGQVVDEVKWRDAYAASPVGNIHFGNVTTVHAVTQATREALAVSERQLNMLVNRLLPVYDPGTNTFSGLAATKNAADIISAISLDPKIGNRTAAEVNFPNIYQTLTEAVGYFGLDAAGEFSYTFDSDNLSYEETISAVADAVFCKALRRGRVIEIQLEMRTPDSVLLFNHRNKVPGTEQRTANFGQSNNNDGIEYDYVSPIDDAVVKFYVPEDRTAVNPVKIESIGVRSVALAYLHSYREFNKLRYRTRSVTFDATQESELVSVGSRVLVADNSRPDTQDGEVEAQDGPVLTLSQPVSIIGGTEYVVFLQLSNGSVEIIPCTWGDTRYKITLLESPSLALVVDDDKFVKTLYQVVKASDVNKGNNKAFLIDEKNPNGNFINTITAYNYDERYYQNDQDFYVGPALRLLDTFTGTSGTPIASHFPDVSPDGFNWVLTNGIGLKLSTGRLIPENNGASANSVATAGTSLLLPITFPYTVEFTARQGSVVSGITYFDLYNSATGAYIYFAVETDDETNSSIFAEINDGVVFDWQSSTSADATAAHKISVYMEADKFTFSIDGILNEVFPVAFPLITWDRLEIGMNHNDDDTAYIDKLDIRSGP